METIEGIGKCMVESSRLTGRFLFTVGNHLDAREWGRLSGISGGNHFAIKKSGTYKAMPSASCKSRRIIEIDMRKHKQKAAGKIDAEASGARLLLLSEILSAPPKCK